MLRKHLSFPHEATTRPRRNLASSVILTTLCICFLVFFHWHFLHDYVYDNDQSLVLSSQDLDAINQKSLEYIKAPIRSPYKGEFWEAGQRLKTLGHWITSLDQLGSRSSARHEILYAVEAVAATFVPFLGTTSSIPLQDLRTSFQHHSRGIVIPVGGSGDTIRFASHLISSLRLVLGCELPIQIAYAGDDDLPQTDRDRIAALDGATDLSFLNVLSVFDDSKLKLTEGHWAIKPFAALASPFEQVILLDADAVFLQKPEVLFDQEAFIRYGAYLFHDRLLWQHAYPERREWLRDQIKDPSPAMNRSLFWTEEYAEECDSGVVVIDKSRIEVLMGLLHTSWQNTQEVRDEVTYRLTYGDKESWWLGLELVGSGYAFETHYGSMLGWESPCGPQTNDICVCSFSIAHLDDSGSLIWYNGSLLKNKRVDAKYYETPEAWMTDGEWRKGVQREDMSCMTKAPVRPLKKVERKALEMSIEVAQRVDRVLDSR